MLLNQTVQTVKKMREGNQTEKFSGECNIIILKHSAHIIILGD